MYEMLFDDRDPVTEPGTATGTPGDWWTVFALVPDILRPRRRRASPSTRAPGGCSTRCCGELGQTRAGWAAGSQFVYSQHCKSLRDLGVSEERIAAVAAGSVADCFTPVERLVLGYTDCLVYDHGRVPDAVFDAAPRRAGRRGRAGADLHHQPVPAARRHVASVAHPVRRPRRSRRGDRRPRGPAGARHRPRHQRRLIRSSVRRGGSPAWRPARPTRPARGRPARGRGR